VYTKDPPFFIILFKHLYKVAQSIITILLDCPRELKKGATNIFKRANILPSEYSKIIYKSGCKYLAKLIFDYRKNPFFVCLLF